MNWQKITLGIIFLLFAALQYNDPDPLLWIFIYGLVSALCFASLILDISKNIYLLVFGLGALYSLIYIPGVYTWLVSGEFVEIAASMKVDKPYIEESREFLGLWLALGAVFYLYKNAD